jgi:hypothetical protein
VTTVKNFMAKMMETFEQQRLQQVLKSWYLQDKPEKKARMQAVLELAAELHKIKAVSNFSSMFGELVIERIIEGNWSEALGLVRHLRFKEERDETQAKYAPLWENFVVMTETFCAQAAARAAGANTDPS